MPAPLLPPSTSPLLFSPRPTFRAPSCPLVITHAQHRHATMLRRPIRPYMFTQLLTLSDGSTTITRTTSPLPIYKSTKDTRNHPMWNPSSQKLANVEEDEAGRLRAFRKRFGRGWDAEVTSTEGEDGDGGGLLAGDGEEGLIDLISGYQGGAERVEAPNGDGAGARGDGKGKGKGKQNAG